MENDDKQSDGQRGLERQTKTIQGQSAAANSPLWKDSLFWLTIGLTIFAVAPFLQPGYHWGANDARHHVYFLFEFDRVVQDGIWWPRWSPDFAFGYGYPFFNIYGPLSHFCAELLLHFLRFSYTGAVEAIFVLSIVGSAATMYIFVRSWVGRQAGMVAALVYVYIPYHLLNLYVRANLAESVAFVWLPLCLWTVRQSIVQPSLRWVIGIALCFAGLIITSPLVTALLLPLMMLYTLVLILNYATPDGTADLMLPGWVRLWHWVRCAILPGLGMIAAVGLSALFWLPLVQERQFVRVDQWFDGRYDFHGHFLYLHQLFSPSWEFGISVVGPEDSMGFQLGVVPLILALIGVLLMWPQAGKRRGEIACFVLVGSGATFIGLQWAAPLWDLPIIGGLLGVAQFPWRWFNLASLCIGILAGLIMDPMLQTERLQPLLNLHLMAVVAVILIGSYPLLQVQISDPVEGPVSLAGLMRFQRTSDEMTGSTAWVDEIPKWSSTADHYINQAEQGKEIIEPIESKMDYGIFDYDCETGLAANSEAHNTIMEELWYCAGTDDKRIIFNHFYYPGWKAYLLDGKHGSIVRELEIIPEAEGIPGEVRIPSGRMAVPVPKGEGFVLLRFEDTQPRIIGKTISQATLIILLLLGLFVLISERRAYRNQAGTL